MNESSVNLPPIKPLVAQAAALVPALPPVIKPLPWWVSFSINTGIGAVHMALRNPEYAADLKEVLLELRDAISATYAPE